MAMDSMTLTPRDAAAALRDIEEAQARSATLQNYHRAAPHFMLWGVLWVVAYTLSDFFPMHRGAIWAVVVPIGVIAGLIVTRGGRSGLGWRYGAGMVAVVVFFFAAALVMWPVSDRQVAAFIPLFVALMYVLRGIGSGLRYVGAGICVAVLTLLGFFLLKDHFFLWMAGVGGGSLILASVWLQRV
jgi:hypothetical protein